jgi:hypothetical protein
VRTYLNLALKKAENMNCNMNKLTPLTKPALNATVRLAAIAVAGLATLQCAQGALLHHWDFNTNGVDSVSGSNVTLVGTATISGGSLNIPGGGVFADYASVNLSSTLTANPTLTVECWYTQNVLVPWSKVWMFGADNAGGETALAYIDFTPYTGLGGNPPKIDYDPNDNNELNAAGPSALNAAQQYHVVTVYDASQNLMSLWINGVLTATNGMGGETIQNVGYNTARFGSGFYYGDPELNGSINDIRIYNHAVGPLQIAVNFAAGPDTVPSSYVPTTVYLNLGSTNLLGGQTESGNVTADFGSLLGVPVTAAVTNWSSSNPGVVTVNSAGLLTAVGAGNATITATVAGVSGSAAVSVAAVQPTISQDLTPLTVFVDSPVALAVGAQGGNLVYYWYKNSVLVPSQTNSTFSFAAIALTDAGNYSVTVSNVVGTASSSTVTVAVLQQSLDHRYSFASDVTDSIAGANGTTVNNITFSNGSAIFPGTSPSGPTGDYIQLPVGLISPYQSVTFELWATILPNGNWNQICSFGDQSGTAGNTYLAVIPHSGAGDYRMTIKSLSVERATSGATPVDTSTPVHLVAVYNADTSQELLYANGVLVSTRSTTIDIANVNNQNSWLGRSLFDGDASLKGGIDEFRVWNGPLSRLQIVVNDGLGPNSVNTNAGAFLNLASISVANTTMVGGTSQQGTALANFANVSGVPFNTVVTNWTSSNTNVATVNATGLISAIGQGTTSVRATALGSTASVTITVLAVQPTISQQPAPQTRFLGGSAQFTVVASGGQLTYQWLKTGSPVANATNSQFALAGLVSGDAADYTVKITNSAGSITSSIAHLTVSALPGGYAGTVMGDNPAAYWRLDETNGTTAVDIYGTNYATYSGSYTLGVPGALFGDSDTALRVASGAKAEAPYSSLLNNPAGPFSVEVWARTFDTASSAVVSSQNKVGNDRSGYVIFHNLSGNFWQARLGNTTGISLDLPGSTQIVRSNWYHVALTFDGTNCTLYVNGNRENGAAISLPAFNPNPASPFEMGVQNSNISPDNGDLDEVAVYRYALSPTQVADHNAMGRSGTLAATIVANPAPASIQSVVGVSQTFTASATGQPPLTLQWLKNGVAIPGANGANLTLPSIQLSDAGSYTLTASNSVGGKVTSAPGVLTVVNNPFLVHRWSFNDGTDSISGSNATLFGTASYSGGQLVLPGGGHLVSYATVNIAPTFANSPSLTFEGWFTDSSLANWAKVWMFGISTANYIDFTPMRGNNGNVPSMSFNPFGAEVNTSNLPLEPPVLTAGTVYHVVAAYDSARNQMNLYLNGALVATNNMLGSDLTQVQAVTGYFGASLFNDPDLTGSIDEMRVWRGALSAAQVAATDFAGTSSVPDFNVKLTAQLSGGTLTLFWSSGTLLQATSLAGPWTPVGGASPPSFPVSISGAPIKFYRVQVQ